MTTTFLDGLDGKLTGGARHDGIDGGSVEMRRAVMVAVMLVSSVGRAQDISDARDPDRVLISRAALERMSQPIPLPEPVANARRACDDGDRSACVRAAGFYKVGGTFVGFCAPTAVGLLERACKLGDKASCRPALKRRFRAELADFKARARAGTSDEPTWMTRDEYRRMLTDVHGEVMRLDALYREASSPGTYDEKACAGALLPEPPTQAQLLRQFMRHGQPIIGDTSAQSAPDAGATPDGGACD